MKKGLLALASILGLCLSFIACSKETVETIDVGQGFESNELYAPWDGLTTDTRFCCHATSERFYFSFEVEDSTLTLTEPFKDEMDVMPEDRVEVFFAADSKMKKPYYGIEIDPMGRVHDYESTYYRKFKYDWNISTLQTHTAITPRGYRVGGSILLSELKELGMNLESGFWMGVFQADFYQKEKVNWYALHAPDVDHADFHKPDVLFPCTITPAPEHRGIVLYPNDITSLGLEEWEHRIDLSGINLIGLHAATFIDPIDSLEAFIKSQIGQDFLKMCQRKDVDVEYEVHALQYLLPRNLFEIHPEYFPEDTNGVRKQDYNICFTSEEAVEAMRPQLEALLQWMHPTTHRYFFWPDDTNAECHCEACRGYSTSEQNLIYENRFLKLLREYDPEATLAHLAYAGGLAAPQKIRADEGIFLEFAPISRDYTTGLSTEMNDAYAANLLAFPPYSQHILEYWLDESMFSCWKPAELVPFPSHFEQCAKDISGYRSMGAASITTFATWLNGAYVKQYGKTDEIFTSYGKSFE